MVGMGKGGRGALNQIGEDREEEIGVTGLKESVSTTPCTPPMTEHVHSPLFYFKYNQKEIVTCLVTKAQFKLKAFCIIKRVNAGECI